MAPLLAWILAVVVVTVAVVFDLRQRRIPNWLSLGSLALGLVLQTAVAGTDGLVRALTGAGFALLVLGGFYLAGGMGAGDVKLLVALGAILGPQALASVAAYGGVAGGVMSLFFLAKYRWLPRRAGRPVAPRGQKLMAPYAVAIASGVYLSIMLPPVWR